MCPSQHYTNRRVEILAKLREPPATDPCYEMTARDIEVAEIGAVGLMDVPVAFVPGRPGADDERLEKSSWASRREYGSSSAVYLTKEGVENAELGQSQLRTS